MPEYNISVKNKSEKQYLLSLIVSAIFLQFCGNVNVILYLSPVEFQCICGLKDEWNHIGIQM